MPGLSADTPYMLTTACSSYRDLFQTSSMSIMISSDTKMKYLGIQRENLMKVRRTRV